MSLDELALALSLFWETVLTGAVAGAVLGYLGVFIVLRRMVFVAAGLTQAAGLGVALSFAAGIHLGVDVHPILGALVTALLGAALLSLPAERLDLSSESLLALVWLLGAAGAVLVGSLITQEAHDIAAILFGPQVLVRSQDVQLVVGFGLLALALAVWANRGLVFAGFDPDGARVQGVPVRALELGFLVLVTFVVSVATRAIGALAVFAFSVLPAVAALLVAPRLRWTFPIALVGGALSGVVGYTLAYVGDLPVGASQALVALGLVVVALPVRLMRP